MDRILNTQVTNEHDLMFKANVLITELFKDSYDKEGVPYINHLYYVIDTLDTLEEKIVGALHDTVEDTDVTLDDLTAMGFPKNIVNSIRILTRDKSIPYSEYIDNIINSNDIVAIKVKKVDMSHNMNRTRLNRLDSDTRTRLITKYTPEYEKIENYLKER